jgi:hypothetical protein
MAEDHDFDEMFSDIAENESIENVELILNEEKISYAKKYLNIINSLNQLSVHISAMTIDLLNDPSFSLDKEICDMIEQAYVMSEDLTDLIVNNYYSISIEDFEDISRFFDDENGDEESDEES